MSCVLQTQRAHQDSRRQLQLQAPADPYTVGKAQPSMQQLQSHHSLMRMLLLRVSLVPMSLPHRQGRGQNQRLKLRRQLIGLLGLRALRSWLCASVKQPRSCRQVHLAGFVSNTAVSMSFLPSSQTGLFLPAYACQSTGMPCFLLCGGLRLHHDKFICYHPCTSWVLQL